MPRVRPALRPARLRGDERGQVFVFVLTIVFSLFIFAAASINIGQAVTRRMLLQMTADAGAFTGATVMAQGMNTLAEQNLRIQRAWAGVADATLGFTMPPCPASDLATASYAAVRASMGRLIDKLNTGYGRRAGAQARSVTTFNAVDLFPSEDLTMAESDAESGIGLGRPSDRLVALEDVPSGTPTAPGVGSLTPGYVRRTWSCWTPTVPPVVQPRQGWFSLWFRAKPSSMPISFVWVVTAPRTRARVFDDFFGGRAIPEMKAAAIARPVGGEIKLAKSRYVAKMTPLREIRAQVYDAFFERRRAVAH